jgi:hypothetical protein
MQLGAKLSTWRLSTNRGSSRKAVLRKSAMEPVLSGTTPQNTFEHKYNQQTPAHMHTRTHIHTHAYIHTHAHTHTHTPHTHTHTHMHACISTYIQDTMFITICTHNHAHSNAHMNGT